MRDRRQENGKTEDKKTTGFTGWETGVMGIMRIMGIMHIIESSPAQRDSGDNMRGDLPPVVYNIWSARSTKY